MRVPQTVAAGALVVLCGASVLAGWVLDITLAKSLMVGWRVMVPPTAATFVCLGLALVFGSGLPGRPPNPAASQAWALAGLVLPTLTLVEYLTGSRLGIERWFGIPLEAASPVAGRMSPLTTLSFIVLSIAIAGATRSGVRSLMLARIGAGATLLTAWLAILAMAFDTGRLADAPRFPGMAVLTIVLLALTSWATLELSLGRDLEGRQRPGRSARFGALLVAAFVVPMVLGWMLDMAVSRWSQQLVSSFMVILLTGAMAAIVWKYAARIAALTRERERAFVELEQRVSERTRELAARNEALRQSEDRLREADRRKDEFLATLAHELRNPLAPIRSAVAVLRAPGVGEDDKQQARLIIERQVAQMARLIDDLLDVSRITVGKLPMRKTRLHLADVLNLAVSTVRPHLEQAGHHFTMSLPPESIVVEADEARLSQVFANLLHNACKYTEPGGEIMLIVSPPNDGEVEVTVRDNGIGIPPEFLPRLFEKFSQVAPALDRSQGGLGLGLSLVHGIVTLHGGHVEARSTGSGRGSEFIVRLPVAAVQRATAQAPAAIDMPRNLPSRRVLVVDDNEDSAESLALLLRLEGHIVETAHDGQRAIDLAERFEPDAILLDLGMPRMNGFEVCQRIRTHTWGRSILMVAQTGWGQAQDRARTMEAGFDAHLTKPIDPAVIQDMLASLKPV